MDKHTWKRAQINSKSQSQPIPRWGHNCCVIGEQVVFFGGYADSNYMNDVWSYNTVNMAWTEVKTTGDIPSNRSNCTMNYDRENNRIIVFGGGGPNKKRFNSINILDWNTKDWLEISPKENQNAPWQRTYHAAELVYPYLIVYGGEGIADMDDLWIYNFLTLSWTEVPVDKSKPRPCARRFHSSAIVGNQFFVIAGCHGKYRPLNDVYSIDLTPLLETGNIETLEWKERKFKGSAFLTRWGQSSCVYDNKVYIFGGRFSSDLNDILVIDIEKETMKTLKVGIQAPKPRRRHCACFVGSCLLIFGGFNGEYFNDLYYVNLFQLKSKLVIPTNNKNLLYLRFVGNEHLSDSHVLTAEYQKFPIHKGLIAGAFQGEAAMEKFLSDIDGEQSHQELTKIMTCLYQGFGTLSHSLCSKYQISIPDTLDEKERMTKEDLIATINEKAKSQPITKKSLSNSVPTLTLDDQSFEEFIERQRNPLFSSLTIVVNKEFQIKANGSQLALSSTYFANLLSGRFGDLDEEGKVHATIPHNNVLVFEIMLNYLLMDYVVVPKQMSDNDWMQLCSLAEMYCLGRLLSICEYQLCIRVGEDNFARMMDFALDLELDILALWCSDFQIKLMVAKEELCPESPNESAEMKAKKDFILKMVYQMLRFDILQVRLEKDRYLESDLKKKESVSTQDEKENYEINYNQ